ncbi:MAG TPA: hypothetical protein VFO70_01275, partial [Chitinophagaceae bacterium]|nr:hypothetical protein [Chitinophagaceae bacterium]
MDRVKKYKLSWLKLGRIVAKTILYVILFILILVLAVHLPPVQRLIRVKVLSYLERTLETKVQVGKIIISLPENIQLDDVYVEDRQKDTLLAGGVLKANINLWRLAFNNEVNVESVSLENITAKFNRKNSTEGFNFQFVIDAFPGKPKTRNSADSSSAISLKKITLNKVRLVYNDSISGNDLAAWINHLDARIDLFDPQRLQFDVPEATIDGLDAHIYQRKPLASEESQTKDIKEALEPIPLQIQFKKTSLNNIELNYRNDVSATYADFDLGKLVVEAENIDLPHRIINLEGLLLDRSSIILRLGQKEEARIVAKETEQEIRSQVVAG